MASDRNIGGIPDDGFWEMKPPKISYDAQEYDKETTKYKFNEDVLLDEIKVYIDKTYSAHYAGNVDEDIQTYQLIVKKPIRGLFFAIGNVLKYGDRYGFKKGHNRDDILKTIHYGILALYAHDKMKNEEKENNETLGQNY